MTLDNGWFLHEVSILGSIETGKLGDIIVLSADYSNPKTVSDEDIKKLKSVLTVVDGKIVYDEMK
jgi:predicted amidohydrolase YtcJ